MSTAHEPSPPISLVFLVEDRSMKSFLEGFLPRLLPESVHHQLLPHEGKSDLLASIPRKLQTWNIPNTHFIVLIDKDNRDCIELKQHIQSLCQQAGKPETLIRIACCELESWFLADLQAVEDGLGCRGLARLQNQRKYRNPDTLGSPSQELKKLVTTYGKVRGAQQLGTLLQINNPRSPSFRNFVSGLVTLVDSIQLQQAASTSAVPPSLP